jgi:hypothetical protein
MKIRWGFAEVSTAFVHKGYESQTTRKSVPQINMPHLQHHRSHSYCKMVSLQFHPIQQQYHPTIPTSTQSRIWGGLVFPSSNLHPIQQQYHPIIPTSTPSRIWGGVVFLSSNFHPIQQQYHPIIPTSTPSRIWGGVVFPSSNFHYPLQHQP